MTPQRGLRLRPATAGITHEPRGRGTHSRCRRVATLASPRDRVAGRGAVADQSPTSGFVSRPCPGCLRAETRPRVAAITDTLPSSSSFSARLDAIGIGWNPTGTCAIGWGSDGEAEPRCVRACVRACARYLRLCPPGCRAAPGKRAPMSPGSSPLLSAPLGSSGCVLVGHRSPATGSRRRQSLGSVTARTRPPPCSQTRP